MRMFQSNGGSDISGVFLFAFDAGKKKTLRRRNTFFRVFFLLLVRWVDRWVYYSIFACFRINSGRKSFEQVFAIDKNFYENIRKFIVDVYSSYTK